MTEKITEAITDIWEYITDPDVVADWWQQLGQWITQVDQWLKRHDTDIDLITVWSIAVGLGVWAVVKAYSWWAIWHSRDRTAIGRTMRPQKAAEAVMGLSLALLYGLTLVVFYISWVPDFWTRLALRVLLIIATVSASWFGVRFARALWGARNQS